MPVDRGVFQVRGRKPQGKRGSTIVLPDDLRAWLRDQSSVRRMTMSEIVENLLQREREQGEIESLEKETA